MTNKNKLHKMMMDIEKPVRREFRTQKSRAWFWWLVLIVVVLVSYWEVSNIVDYQAHQATLVEQAMAAEVGPLCAQYLNDTKLSGTAAEETLRQICPK